MRNKQQVVRLSWDAPLPRESTVQRTVYNNTHGMIINLFLIMEPREVQ